MKLKRILIATSLLIMCCIMGRLHATSLSSQNSKINNDTVSAIRLKALTTKEAKLQKQIQEQDKKRNTTFNSVSLETIEKINNKQDSICLDLRSRLVSVQLEITELKRTNLLQTLENRKKKDTK